MSARDDWRCAELDASSTVRLPDDQLERLAQLIAAQIVPAADCGLVDANAVAAALGVSRAFAYQHARELGGKRLTPRGRLRFDLEQARAAFAEMAPMGNTTPAPRKRRTASTGTHVLASRPRGGAA